MAGAPGYVKAVWAAERYIALAPPGGHVEIGDVFKMSHGVPVFMFNLKDRKIDFGIRRDRTEGVWVAQAAHGVAVKAKLSGKSLRGIKLASLGLEDAGCVVSLQSEDAFVMSLKGARFDVMKDVVHVEDQIRRRFFWSWDWQWLIVTEVCVAQRGTFLSTGTANSTVELKANAGLQVGKSLSLGEISAGFKLVSHTESTEMFVARTKVTPLFRAHKWNPIFGVVGGSSRFAMAAPADVFGAPHGPGVGPPQGLEGKLVPYELEDF
jgi:hypothetical protein